LKIPPKDREALLKPQKRINRSRL